MAFVALNKNPLHNNRFIYTSDETNIIPFNNELYFLVRCIQKHNVLVIDESINACRGKDRFSIFCLHNRSNSNN